VLDIAIDHRIFLHELPAYISVVVFLSSSGQNENGAGNRTNRSTKFLDAQGAATPTMQRHARYAPRNADVSFRTESTFSQITKLAVDPVR